MGGHEPLDRSCEEKTFMIRTKYQFRVSLVLMVRLFSGRRILHWLQIRKKLVLWIPHDIHDGSGAFMWEKNMARWFRKVCGVQKSLCGIVDVDDCTSIMLRESTFVRPSIGSIHRYLFNPPPRSFSHSVDILFCNDLVPKRCAIAG